MWPGFEKEKVLISGHAKRKHAGLDGTSREVSRGVDPGRRECQLCTGTQSSFEPKTLQTDKRGETISPVSLNLQKCLGRSQTVPPRPLVYQLAA